MEEKAKQVAELLKVLANENRLLILCVLIAQPMSVNEIAAKINGISQSAISQHLSILKAHSILDYEKQGQRIIYRISDKRIEAVLQVIKVHYCD